MATKRKVNKVSKRSASVVDKKYTPPAEYFSGYIAVAWDLDGSYWTWGNGDTEAEAISSLEYACGAHGPVTVIKVG